MFDNLVSVVDHPSLSYQTINLDNNIGQSWLHLDVEKGDGEGKDGDGHEEEDGVDHGVVGAVGVPTLPEEGCACPQRRDLQTASACSARCQDGQSLPLKVRNWKSRGFSTEYHQ